jgi:hypothetical protein
MRRDLRESINARARELMRAGMVWMDAHRQADKEHRCGARCRTGLSCVRKAGTRKSSLRESWRKEHRRQDRRGSRAS